MTFFAWCLFNSIAQSMQTAYYRNAKNVLSLLAFIILSVVVIGLMLWKNFQSKNASPHLTQISILEQLKYPQIYFDHSITKDVAEFRFKHPTISPVDLTKLGLRATTEAVVEGKRTWSLKFSPNQSSVARANLNPTIIFESNRLTKITFPASVNQFINAKTLNQYLTMLGHSRIEPRKRRSVFDAKDGGPKIEPQPFLYYSEFLELFGEPDLEKLDENKRILQYSYEQLSQGGGKPTPLQIFITFHRVTGAFNKAVLHYGRYLVSFNDHDISVTLLK
jgi:hypothetical protein